MIRKSVILLCVTLCLFTGADRMIYAERLYSATVPFFSDGLDLNTGNFQRDRTVLVVYFGNADDIEEVLKPILANLADFGPNINVSFDFNATAIEPIGMLSENIEAMIFVDETFDDIVLDDAFIAEYTHQLDQSQLMAAVVDFDDIMLVRTTEDEYFALGHFERVPGDLAVTLDVKGVVPEPGTVILLGLGLLGIIGIIRKKKGSGSKGILWLVLVLVLADSLVFAETSLAAAIIQGIKFNDGNGNGMRDADEPGLGGETIFIRDNSTYILHQEITDENGDFSFESANGGSFRVWSRIPPGWRQTTPVDGTGTLPYTVEITQNQTLTIDFGIRDMDLSENSPPETRIDINSMAVRKGETAVFTGSFTDVDPADTHTVRWDFDDGNTTDTLTAMHVYDSTGEYTVTLIVTDSQGGEGTSTSQITVSDEALHQNFDARIEATAGVSFAPGVSQLIAEDELRVQNGDLTITYERTTGAVRTLYSMTGYLSDESFSDESPDAEAIALNYVQEHLELLGLSEADIAGMELTDSVYSQVTGARHLYWRQTYQGLPVYNAQLHINVNRNGRIISVNNSFMPSLSSGFNTLQPTLSAGEAVMTAMQHLGINMSTPPAELSSSEGIQQRTVVEHTGISLESIKANLMLLPVQLDDVRLVWNFQIFTLDEQHAYDMTVDAENSEVLTRFDWVDSDDYRVYSLPQVESPNHTTPLPPSDARTLITSATTPASPYGWHDTDGTAGSEFTITRGNNVHAYRPGTSEPDCGTGLECDFPINLSGNPSAYTDASVAELFYVNNIIHDVMFQYGFDSPAGNFQENIYGASDGLGGDSVNARAQISVLNQCNAFFGTPSDGSSPTMSMYICDRNGDGNQVDGVFDHGVVIHEYGHGISNRLVGGPSNVSCLQNRQQPGEGIGDWLALVFTHDPGDVGTDVRGVGSYLFELPVDGTIRPQPYSTDPNVNTYTYESINGLSVPHGVGSVLAQALWEVYWAVVDRHGFDPDLYDAQGGSGNQRMLLYFTEGLKNTACSPTFLDVRDGIIQAARDSYNGEDVCLIWNIFAQFGLGVDAVSGGPNSTTPTNGFQAPVECAAAACDTPTVRSRNTGNWHTSNTWERSSNGSWSSGTGPGSDDTVLLQTNHIVSAQAVINVGILCIAEDGVLELKDNPTPVLVNAKNIYNDGTIQGQNGNPGQCEGSSSGSSLFIPPMDGSSVDLWVNQMVINNGTIEAGCGGHAITHGLDITDRTTPCPYAQTLTAEGGVGGFVQVNADIIMNNGTIGPEGPNSYQNEMVYAYGGSGGVGSNSYEVRYDCSGLPDSGYQGNLGIKVESQSYGGYNRGSATGGNGGNTTVNGTNELVNTGRISAGYGGDARTFTCSQTPIPGEGGTAQAFSKGLRIPGTIDGGGGKVVAEPEILLSGPNMRIENSKEVLIFGGDDWQLILRNLSPNAITAEETITLAVGENGVIDLRGNSSAIMKAGNKVEIFSDTILLDPGVTLEDVIDAPAVETHESKILYEVALSSPNSIVGQPGTTVPINLKVLNSGPTADTYTLTVTDTAGWSMGTLPNTIIVDGLQTVQVELEVTLPEIPGTSDEITVTAVSQADPETIATAEIEISVQPAYLTIKKSGNGSGGVIVGERECDAACLEMKVFYADNTAIVLKAIPEADSFLVRWEDEDGNELGVDGAVRVEADGTVIAIFGKRN